MAKTVSLAQQVDGINRRRVKGGASPEGLYDLLNGYVTAKGTIAARPGTVRVVDLGPDTKGLVGFQGIFHTFSSSFGGEYFAPVHFRVHRLRHPTGGGAPLLRIHRAFPFLGRLYVVAEFTDGVVRHYYLDEPAVWTANRALNVGDRIRPTLDNGFYYEVIGLAGGAAMPNAWRQNSAVNVGDYRQPSVYNGFKYYLNLVAGSASFVASPLTSNHEPVWPVVNLATVIERRYHTETQEPPDNTPDAPPEPPPSDPPDDYGPYPPTVPPGPPTVIR